MIRPGLLKLARGMRQNLTTAERVLWSKLRGKQMLGIRFRRQAPLGYFIVDFYAPRAGLVIELDGGQHYERKNEDIERTRRLKQMGLRVLRFWNNEAVGNLGGVLEKIRQELESPMPIEDHRPEFESPSP